MKRKTILKSLWLKFADEIDGGSSSSATPLPEVVTDEATGVVTGSIPINDPVAPEPKNDFLSSVPEEYRGKPFMQKVKSVEDLIKMYDGAQSLIGKKTISAPADDAPEEEWEKFFAANRPEKADDYVLELSGLPEERKAYADIVKEIETPEYLGEVRSLLHKVGVTKKQAAVLYPAMQELNAKLYDAEVSKAAAHAAEEDRRLGEEFETFATSAFKDKRDDVLSRARSLLNENASEFTKKHIEGVDNKTLVLLADVLNNIHSKYIREGGPITIGAGSDGSTESLRDEGRKLTAELMGMNQMDPQYDTKRARVREIYARLGN
jgi:hypothetical protein